MTLALGQLQSLARNPILRVRVCNLLPALWTRTRTATDSLID